MKIEPKTNYGKHDFCKAVGCWNFNNMFPMACDYKGKNPAMCNYTAQELLRWLKYNNFKIVKKED